MPVLYTFKCPDHGAFDEPRSMGDTHPASCPELVSPCGGPSDGSEAPVRCGQPSEKVLSSCAINSRKCTGWGSSLAHDMAWIPEKDRLPKKPMVTVPCLTG